MASLPQGPYKVVPLEMLIRQLRATARSTNDAGVRDGFLATVREIATPLAADPVSWGDPKWEYRAAGFVEYHGLYQLVSVRYAVDRVNRIAYLKECKPVLSHPLAES